MDKKSVFVDLHHGSLYYGLQLLFEKRLGWDLYCPIGLEWFERGFWRLAEPYGNVMDTICQYLGLDHRGFASQARVDSNYQVGDGIYYIFDPVHKCFQKAITFAHFCEMPIDLVISSYAPHDRAYAKMVRDYKPAAKHISLVGNPGQQSASQNVMCSTEPLITRPGQNIVYFHQEIPLDIFKYIPPLPSAKITSFVMGLPEPNLYEWFKAAMPDFEFRAYGNAPDGTITGPWEIARIMSASTFGWHIKPASDGFGHVIHDWFACGRPPIVIGSPYATRLAGQSMEHGVTCIDLERLGSREDAVDYIRACAVPEVHSKMCEAAYRTFRNHVDYDAEEQVLRKFFAGILV